MNDSCGFGAFNRFSKFPNDGFSAIFFLFKPKEERYWNKNTLVPEIKFRLYFHISCFNVELVDKWTWDLAERFFIKWLIEFYYILASQIICKRIFIKFSLKPTFVEGKNMSDFN